jgi:serine/threonine-protein kinase
MIDIGQTVGNYRVVAKLGEGGMGAVYLAEHPVIGRRAALKVIHPQHARNAEVVARFVNEATAINRIGNEHIVEVTDFGRTDAGDFYFIMEHLEGRPLSELIASDAPFAPAHAVGIAAQIADALAASHAHGVIHRDLKPENIFLVARGEDPAFVKVLDFGLAKLLNDDGMAPHKTRVGIVMGTPFYMSPEQCEGTEIDERADVYALGVVLFEMLTGKLPFGGDDCAEVLMKQVSVRAPAARSLVPDLPEELDAILHTALAKRPADRFPTMAAFKQALLAPGGHAVAPHVSVHDDLSGRMRAARPMSRAEIHAARTQPPAALMTADTALDRVPRRKVARTVAFVAVAALTSFGLSTGLTFARAYRKTASPPFAPEAQASSEVSVRFGSDPEGATVLDPQGTALGVTPLSIQVPRTNVSVDYAFVKPGYETRTLSVIPNVPSTVFAAMQAEEPPPEYDPPITRRVESSGRRHRDTRTAQLQRVRDDEDVDGVLAPSFIK